ncbi:transcriptional regulator family: Fungal Specific TF [Aspergillus niger]|nr:transcriptional regulator family: Fungal Specific TF [Aspergillus niger]
MIMAFASIHSPSKSSSIVDKLSRGNVFFYRALYILRSMQPTDVTLESVQATLLVAQYVQGTQRSAQTWSIASSAIYGALQIGLWRQPTVEGLGMSPLEAEVRKRTCMTFGRPPIIPNSYMDCELPLDVPLESLAINAERKTAKRPASTISGARLFLETSKLNTILGQVIEKLYGGNLDRSPSPRLSQQLQDVLGIDQQLAEWKCGLPAGLEILKGSNIIDIDLHSSTESLRFRVVMSLRYHSLTTLLHRKVLEWLLECSGSTMSGPGITDFLHTVINGSIDMCINSARDTISVIASISDHHILLPIWWYSVYYVLNSALVLFAVFLLPMRRLSVRPTCTNSEILASLKLAYETLNSLGSGTWIVIRCRKLLYKLVSIVESFDLCTRDSTGDFEDFFSELVRPGLAAFPLSVSDWNSLPIDDGFGVDLYNLEFNGGTGLELPLEGAM